jgi:hypothetical protein
MLQIALDEREHAHKTAVGQRYLTCVRVYLLAVLSCCLDQYCGNDCVGRYLSSCNQYHRSHRT